ncbi:MAG: DUF4325 domain-containing protein [Acidobacteria bacterium]|nr:DUF4325 domain-containing protein [Acidobacteriota bacterium]
MSRVRARGESIRRFILENVQGNPRRITRLAMDRFGVSRQAINAHLGKLVHEGALREKGNTRSRVYELAPILDWHRSYLIAEGPAEDVVWRSDIDPVLGSPPENVRDIWSYGFTEMFNNARDHSAGSAIHVAITKTAVTTEMMIMDDGVGIFRKIQKELNLLDEHHAIFELSKGKLTTDPRYHTGEGIFFTSRMFDKFDILSGGVFFTHEFGDEEDWLLERPQPRDGTAVFMKLNNHTSRTSRRIFEQYTADDDLAFNKTVVPVRLAQYGNDKLISRSQAKRVLARVELFKKVILDFKGVPTIGLAFADEVFRIFPREHPGVELLPINANSEVRRMIVRARAATAGVEGTQGSRPDVSGDNVPKS